MPPRHATASVAKPTDEKLTINIGYVDLGRSICWCRKASMRIEPT